MGFPSPRKTGFVVLLLTVLALASARPVHAYIDPGTGGAAFSALAPVLAMIGVVVAAALGFARNYVRLAFALMWRHRLVALLVGALVVAVALLVWFGLAGGAPAG